MAAALAQDTAEIAKVDAGGPKPQATGRSPAIANVRVLENTITLSASVAAIGLALGTLLAVLITRTDLPGRQAAFAVLVFLLFLPLYVQVAGWEAAFGKLGWLTSIVGAPLLAGMPAVIFIHAMAAVPWVAIIVSIGLMLVRHEEEEVALLETSGPRVVTRIVLPQLAPFLAAAALLAAISAAGEMTVTNIYLIEPGDYTLAEQAFMTLQSEPLPQAVWQLLPSMLATALLVAGGILAVRLLAPLAGRQTEDQRAPLTYRLGPWKLPSAALVWLLLGTLAVLPLASMTYKAGTDVALLDDTPVRTWSAAKCFWLPWTALWSMGSDLGWTVIIAAAAATLDVIVAIPLAEASRRGIWKTWPVLVAAAVAWAVPGPIVGLAIASLLNHDLPLFAWIYDRTVLPAIMAQAIRAAPIVLLTICQAVERFPTAPIEAAQLDGAGRWTILLRVVLPLRKAALVAAWLAGFAIAAGDLAWSNFVMCPGVDTLQRRMFGDIHAGADDRVAAVCLAVSALYFAAALLLLAACRTMLRRE
ncbi:MAG TPA: ABC transporter permease subunit [Pirellulaceae bacterium]|nr:ABC transporter permease subunit [Pirellulaceae bacterium]